MRLSALKEYEDAELTAARIAAALGMYIKKGDGQSWDENAGKDDDRELNIQPGIIYDDLLPGEDIGMVKSDRPNPNLETFRNGQLRAVSAGSRLSFPVPPETITALTVLSGRSWWNRQTDISFSGLVYWRRDTSDVSRTAGNGCRQRQITLPRGLDIESLYTAVYSGPVMPWIDPVKEANARKAQIRGGAATESDWVRASGRHPDDVKARRKAEIDENREQGLIFDTDPANDRGGTSADAKELDASTSESKRKK